MSVSSKFTYEDYLCFPEDGRRHEIIDGEHYASPTPNTKHAVTVGNLLFALAAFVKKHRLGRVFGARFDVVLSEFDVVEPDLLFVSNSRSHVITKDNCQGPPDLIGEVLSESYRRYDEIVKRKLYERVGVLEYWIADPDLESLKIYRRTGEAFGPAEVISTETGGAITTPLLPGSRFRSKTYLPSRPITPVP